MELKAFDTSPLSSSSVKQSESKSNPLNSSSSASLLEEMGEEIILDAAKLEFSHFLKEN